MIVLSPDAVADVERLQTFPDQVNPDAARRAMTADILITRIWHGREARA
jgi:hypothetical protein